MEKEDEGHELRFLLAPFSSSGGLGLAAKIHVVAMPMKAKSPSRCQKQIIQHLGSGWFSPGGWQLKGAVACSLKFMDDRRRPDLDNHQRDPSGWGPNLPVTGRGNASSGGFAFSLFACHLAVAD